MARGQRRYLVEIRRKPDPESLTAEGEDGRAFVTIARLYMEIRSLSPREVFAAQQVKAGVSHEFKGDYFALKPDDQLYWDGRTFN